VILPESFLDFVVPDGDGCVGACGGECRVSRWCGGLALRWSLRSRIDVPWMEGERVYGPDVVYIVDSLSMALECVLFILYSW
jgi:hypothetical protein